MERVRGYLDIETTGFRPRTSELTVVGLYLAYDHKEKRFFQPYGSQISARTLKKALADVDLLYTYNGTRFDLPFIEEKIGLSVGKICWHVDLMYACWERGLHGGLKTVERTLSIPRQSWDVDGWMAVELWHRFCRDGDHASLQRLLAYNREDVLNLSQLRVKLRR